jgi:hypothetical protein
MTRIVTRLTFAIDQRVRTACRLHEVMMKHRPSARLHSPFYNLNCGIGVFRGLFLSLLFIQHFDLEHYYPEGLHRYCLIRRYFSFLYYL